MTAKKNRIYNFLMNDSNVLKSSYIWNSIAAMMNSFQTMVLLVFVTRLGSTEDSSYFVIAYAVANLLYYIGKYGVRQFQVTDIKEKYSYGEYFRARVITNVLYTIAIIIYLLYNGLINGNSYYKSAIILLICLIRMVEAFEDVIHGRMQQKGRLDVAARILGIRLITYVVGFIVFFVITRNLLITLICNFIITLFLAIYLNKMVIGNFYTENDLKCNKIKGIMIECFPLCICTCLNIYTANAPKYTIDSIVSDEIQTKFNIVFMPVFVITLLSGFIYQPIIKKIGEIWNSRDIIGMRKSLRKNILVVILTTIVVLLAGYLLGIPALEIVYGVQLDDYKSILMILLVVGGLIALVNLLIMYITTIRRQTSMMIVYAIMSVIILLFSRTFAVNYGLKGLCLFYGFMIACIVISFIIIIEAKFYKTISETKEE